MNKLKISKQDLAKKVRELKVIDLYNQFVENDIYRAFIVFENGHFTLSHPKILEPIKAFFELSQDFGGHEGVFIGREEGLETLFFAFVHDTRRGLSQGGLRFSKYNSLADILVDGLRLSQGMTRKNALAGLWWGGGKGIMHFPPDITSTEQLLEDKPRRRKFFEAYGRFVASLGGIYYTAEDVGTFTEDMNAILSQNRYTTCISSTNGGSGNPSPFTARGVLRAMQAGWKVISGTDSLKGVKVSVQGAGNVGAPLIKYLSEEGAKIWFCDMSESRIKNLLSEIPSLTLVSSEEIFDLDVDIFAPCAIGAQVNSQTIPRLKVKLICGAANNILKEPENDSILLKEKGILYVPDFVCNRMGIINCADEWLGYLGEDIRVASERVFPDTLRVFKYAKNMAATTSQAAIDLADIAASDLHPLFGHRGRRIIDYLISSGWHKNKNVSLNSDIKEQAFNHLLDETDIRVRWEKNKLFRGNDISIAASPISAAYTPDLSIVLSPLLLDTRARAYEILTGKRPRRILGSNHGGLSLQISIEQAIPYEREEVGLPRFLELCYDVHKRNDESLRQQLHKLGIGFDPETWLDPITEKGGVAVENLFKFLKNSNLITTQNRRLPYSTHCQSVLVSSDVRRDELKVDKRYFLKFKTTEGDEIETCTFFPEFVLGAVAIAVKSNGKYSNLVNKTVINPSNDKEIPVLSVDSLKSEAVFVAPLHSNDDEKIAIENNITNFPEIFDNNGNISIYEFNGVSKEEARSLILEKFGESKTIEKGNWKVTVLKCGRSGTLVIPKRSEQLFVNFEEAKDILKREIENNNITFSHENWKKVTLNYIDKMEPWCISRQYWWGNPIPSDKDEKEVFSTWFSLSALSLQGSGWPENPKPYPIDEVFVDPVFLIRWVIPSQLISLLVTGRPSFKHIFVHGSLHVVERLLKEKENSSPTDFDENRFESFSIKKPMQRRIGNVVEPVTLIKRFGADALRLGFILSLSSSFQYEATLSEDKLILARKALHKLNSKLTNIAIIIKKSSNLSAQLKDNEKDNSVLNNISDLCNRALNYYQQNNFYESANIFLETIEVFSNYCNYVANEYHNQRDISNSGITIKNIIEKMEETFNPLCPYILDKLKKWVNVQADILMQD